MSPIPAPPTLEEQAYRTFRARIQALVDDPNPIDRAAVQAALDALAVDLGET